MITITNLVVCEMSEIREAFEPAFSDYIEPLIQSCAQLQYMQERRGLRF